MSGKKKHIAQRGRGLVIALPYLWLILFFLAPFFLVLKVSLSQSVLGQPPYAPVFDDWSIAAVSNRLQSFTLAAYAGLLEDSLYLQSYVNSLAIAAAATCIMLLIGYPFALAIARAAPQRRPLLVMLAIAPFWTSSLIRVYAWIMILKDEGLLNHALMALGLIKTPLTIFASNWAVLIGVVYSYLPFMVLPLVASLEKQDKALREAAADLGASPFAVFWRITLPLSLPGILAGSLLTFIPAAGEFVIPDLLGGSDTVMIGATLWNDFFANRDWPTAAAAALLMLLLLVGPFILYERIELYKSDS
jgi:putrescine transport system permease protein